MSRKDVRFVPARMADGAGLAMSYVGGLPKEEFLADQRTQQAVIMNLLIIRELAGTLQRTFKAELSGLPALPCQPMIGTRDSIVHGYFDLNWNAVWEAVCVSLADLRSALAQIGITGVDGLQPLKDEP